MCWRDSRPQALGVRRPDKCAINLVLSAACVFNCTQLVADKKHRSRAVAVMNIMFDTNHFAADHEVYASAGDWR